MARYAFYFHYWLSYEPIQAIIDFDPQDKASILFEEVYDEITHHIGDEPNPGTLLFVDMFGLRPFNPKAWEMSLEEFVGDYGNTFVIFDLEQSNIGDIENFRPKQVAGPQRNKFMSININDEDWQQRAKFETRLVSALIRYFQFYRKTKWILVLPLEGLKYQHRLWKVSTAIPETNYSAEWRIILPDGYPKELPKLFIRKKDVYVVTDFDYSLIWTDPDGTVFYHISDINFESTKWEDSHFLVDFLLSGLWNFLVRALHTTFPRLLFYKNGVATPSLILETPKDRPPVSKINFSRKNLYSESMVEEDDPDWRVQITEVMEDIVYDQKSLDAKIKDGNQQFEPEHNKIDKDQFEPTRPEMPIQKDVINDIKPADRKYQDWITDKSDDKTLQEFADFFSWALQRIPEKALKDLNLLKDYDPEHPIFNKINWRLVQDELKTDKLFPFAQNIVIYYLKLVDTELYDTDREFLRETVLKKWKDVEKVSELKAELKKNVSKIRTVEYESIQVD